MRLIGASGLKSARDAGPLDAYAVVRIGRLSEHKSRICFGAVDPKWDEDFFLAAPKSTAIPLSVEIRSMDIVSSESLGRGSIDFSWLDENQGLVDITLKLDPPTTRTANIAKISFDETQSSNQRPRGVSGELDLPGAATGSAGEVRLQLRREVCRARELDDLALGADWVPARHRQRTVVVELIKGRKLIPRDDNGFSDAYVRLRLAGSTQQSRVVSRSLHPKWRERFEFCFTERRDPAHLTLNLEVWDRDMLSRDDPMGTATLDLSKLPENIVNECWVDVSLDDKPAGALHILVTIMDCDEDLVLSKDQRKLSVGSLRVHVIRARNLMAADSNGRSDPFCELSLGNARLRTPVEPKTLEPVWDRLVELPVSDIFACLDLTVWDYDPDSRPEPLGAVRIPLQRIIDNEPVWFPLKTMDLTGRAKGEVLLAMRLEYNPISALLALRLSRERNHMERLPAFSPSRLRNALNRLMPISTLALQTYIYCFGILTWKYGALASMGGIGAWTAICLWFRPFMVPLVLLVLLIYNYFYDYQGNHVHINSDGLLETRFQDEDTDALIQQTMDTFGLEEDFDANEALRATAEPRNDRLDGETRQPDKEALTSESIEFAASAADSSKQQTQNYNNSNEPSLGQSRPSLLPSTESLSSIPEDYIFDEDDSYSDIDDQHHRNQQKPIKDEKYKEGRTRQERSADEGRLARSQFLQRQVRSWVQFGYSVVKKSYLVAMAQDSFVGDAIRELIATHAPKLLLLQDDYVLNQPFLEQLRILSRLGKQFQDQLEFVASSAERIKNLSNWTVPMLTALVATILFLTTIALLALPWNICLLLFGYGAFVDTWITRYVQKDPYWISRSRVLEFLSRVPSDVDKAKCTQFRSLMRSAPPPPSMKLKRHYSEDLRARLSDLGERFMHINRYGARRLATK